MLGKANHQCSSRPPKRPKIVFPGYIYGYTYVRFETKKNIQYPSFPSAIFPSKNAHTYFS